MVYAAASLREALQDLAGPCGREADAALVFNFGASNDLVRQIEAAGKADLFISADESLMDRLQAADLLQPGTRRSLLGNRLVVIVPSDAAIKVTGAQDLARKAKRLSLANPEAVPVGKYARAWLEKAGVWEQVKGRVVPGVDVRAALAAVESGAVDFGIVYRTDAAISKKVEVVYEVSESEGPAVSYPAALIRDRPALATSRRVAECLSGSAAKAVFEARGFVFVSRSP